MNYCPRCQRYFIPGIKSCPDCEADLEIEPDREDELVPVFEPTDQMAAMAAVALLEEHGIQAVAKSEQIAMYDGLAMMMRPKWGKVLVLGNDEQRAREILDDFLEGAAESMPEDDSGED